ncbi:MAG: hypothetical protein ACR2GU_11300 [Rubrobacteraceae bacterium]
MDNHVEDTGARLFTRQINDELSAQPTLSLEGSNPQLVGTAFDYGFRWLHGPLEARSAVAGASISKHFFGWKHAEELIQSVIHEGNVTMDLETRAQCCVVLAWFEWIFRSGMFTPAFEPFVQKPNSSRTVQEMCNTAPVPTVTDLMGLLRTVPGVWKADLGHAFIMNPTFLGSTLVGGADADWITERTLYECKCSLEKRPFGRRELLQGVGYLLLDFEDVYSIQSIGWYYARQQTRLTYDILAFIDKLFSTADLKELRQDFLRTIRAQAQ